ncbi:hypothetical protein [Acinetobacter pseudolwoffii]|uniref:hypothetical protein n=1 Tax=Acinetobacter pseudolwoffii TaxID=2053287 RepID=UPI000C23B048|nr:hypothetical protein [Acinetobacter pseudolwoffii]PJI35153.1 hypothetical protein CU318_09280 [Acinetobacter pseudolwoffii]
MPFPSMFKACLISGSLLFLAGCQQPSEPQIQVEQTETNQKQSPVNDFSLMCKNIEKNMSQINDQRTTFALEQVNQDLKVCLPLMELAEQKHLMLRSTEMYQRFLAVDRTEFQQRAFEQYALEMAQHPTIQQAHFQQLTSRDQYLLKHKGQAYVELLDLGDGNLHYRRSPEYLARIFAPYLPDAEKVFIEHLAEQNMQPVLVEKRLQIEAADIAARSLLWEDYLKTYPESSYKRDAEYLLKQYTYFLFRGTEASPVSEDYRDRYAVDTSHLETIIGLSSGQKSTLSTQARQFLEFLDMNPQQRQQALPADYRNRSDAEQILYYAKISPPSQKYDKDCFMDAFCI